MIIEFFGPPGAGKSALARELAKRLNKEYISIAGPGEKWAYFWQFVRHSPGRFLYLSWLTVKESRFSPALLRHKLFLLSQHLAAAEKARVLARDETVLLDGGLAQYALSVYEHPLRFEEIEFYARRYIKSEIVVAVVASAEIRRRRMVERRRVPRADLGFDQPAWQALVAANAEQFISFWDRHQSEQQLVLKVDSSALTPELLGEIIQAKIQTRWPQ